MLFASFNFDGCVQEPPEISDEVLFINNLYHQLCLHQFGIRWDLKVAVFTLANLKDGLILCDWYFQAFKSLDV